MDADDSTFGRFALNFKSGHYPMEAGAEAASGEVAIVLDDVAKIAQDAGDKIMEFYNAPDFEEKIEKDEKGDGSPLTQADLAANKIICDGLKKLYPNIPIVSEENKQLPYEERKKWKYFWCVDPLDGTKEFIKRNGQFTVNIGLCQDKSPIAGVVFCPALDPPLMYKGYTGAPPAVKEEVGYAGGYDSFKAIFPKAFDPAVDSGITVVASASHNSPETEAFISKFNSPKTTSMGSSLKLLMVADGQAHIYPRLAPTMEWDTCAAHAIVKCGQVSGNFATVTQHEGDMPCTPGAEVEYNKENQRNPYFVVSGPQVKKVVKKKKKVGLGGGNEKAAAGGINPMLIVLAVLLALVAVGAVMMQKK